jgi:hypothetical protein
LAQSRRDQQNATAEAVATPAVPAPAGPTPAIAARRRGGQVRAPRRSSVEDKLAEWERVTAFIAMKVGGLVCLGAGITDVLSPALLHLPVSDAALFPLGFGLLVGKRALDLCSRYVVIKPRVPTGC